MRFNPTLHRGTRAIQRAETPRFEQIVQQAIIDSLKKLLSTRGLYQKETCDLDLLVKGLIVLPDPQSGRPIEISDIIRKPGLLAELPPKADPNRMTLTDAKLEASIRIWNPDNTDALHSEIGAGAMIGAGNRVEILNQPISFRPLNFTSECPECGTCVFCVRFHQSGDHTRTPKGTLQVWHLYCRCESCREFTNVFSVKRVGLQLMLVGRSERAVAPVHKLIPKELCTVVSDAINATNENDVFGGLYHLRTFVEHYIKAAIGESVEAKIDGDTLCSRYNETLDHRMKLGMPSLTPIYSELSERIHARSGEKSDFDAALNLVQQHLEAKDMFARHKHDKPGSDTDK